MPTQAKDRTMDPIYKNRLIKERDAKQAQLLNMVDIFYKTRADLRIQELNMKLLRDNIGEIERELNAN